MPPKKAEPTPDGEKAGGPFRWTSEMDYKLMLLSLGRTLSKKDYEEILPLFPGTNYKGLTLRASKFRVEQRKLLEDVGWSTPDRKLTDGSPDDRSLPVTKGIPVMKASRRRKMPPVEEDPQDDDEVSKGKKAKLEDTGKKVSGKKNSGKKDVGKKDIDKEDIEKEDIDKEDTGKEDTDVIKEEGQDGE